LANLYPTPSADEKAAACLRTDWLDMGGQPKANGLG
jgi:hypothetical protein